MQLNEKVQNIPLFRGLLRFSPLTPSCGAGAVASFQRSLGDTAGNRNSDLGWADAEEKISVSHGTGSGHGLRSNFGE